MSPGVLPTSGLLHIIIKVIPQDYSPDTSVIIRKLAAQYSESSEHFSSSELYDDAPYVPPTKLIFTPLLTLAEAVREDWGKPLTVNAGVRTRAKQEALRQAGYKTAGYSPHVYRCALDLDTADRAETERLVHCIRRASEKTGIPCRIGWLEYLRVKQTFVHVDVAPLIADAALAANVIPRWVHRAWSQAGLEW